MIVLAHSKITNHTNSTYALALVLGGGGRAFFSHFSPLPKQSTLVIRDLGAIRRLYANLSAIQIAMAIRLKFRLFTGESHTKEG